MDTFTTMAGERTNYLAIALRARGAIKTLRSMMRAQQGLLSFPDPELQQDLKSVVQSLRAIESSRPIRARLADEVPYHRFEEVQTIDEVSQLFKDAKLLPPLEALINGGCNQDDMRAAIRLFSAIERRALYHYSDPSWAGSGV